MGWLTLLDHLQIFHHFLLSILLSWINIISRIIIFPYINYLVWSTKKQDIQTDSLRQAHCGHNPGEHRASLQKCSALMWFPHRVPFISSILKSFEHKHLCWTKKLQTLQGQIQTSQSIICTSPARCLRRATLLFWDQFNPLPWFLWLWNTTF